MGQFWGEGEIIGVSHDSFGGSRLYPVFNVLSDDGTSIWLPAISLHEVE